MRGKFVNAIVGLMNLLYGVVVLFFNFYMPNTARATEQELIVINEISSFIFILMIVVLIANFITLLFNYKDKVFLFSYILAIASSSFYFLDFEYIAILYILSALLIEIQVLRENMISVNNVFYIVIISIIIVAIGLAGISILTYEDRVQKIVKKENVGYTEYQTEYFKNISELGEDAEFYINVKRNGKWGYINTSGETKIEFIYDYALPFVTIEQYDKKFDIALVCEGDTASIILKNKRVVMSFKNDISYDDYLSQFEKFDQLYKESFKQEGNISDKLVSINTSNMTTISAYENYPYRYPFNDEYDIYITVSQTGGKNRYEFLKKSNPNVRISIDCDNLKFDEDNLYVFSNGYLPFYKRSEGIQGWYTKETKRVEMNGNIQILEFYDDKILIKDYDQGILYFANENGEKISPNYKDIFVLRDSYIVKGENDKYIIIDNQFQKILDIEYDYINPVLIEKGLLVCANLPVRVNFNSSGFPDNIEYDLVDLTGRKIGLKNVDGTYIENPAYTELYYITSKKTVSSYDVYMADFTDIDYNFIGEEFYQ